MYIGRNAQNLKKWVLLDIQCTLSLWEPLSELTKDPEEAAETKETEEIVETEEIENVTEWINELSEKLNKVSADHVE